MLSILTVLTWLSLGLVLSTVIGVEGPGDRDMFLGFRWTLSAALIGLLWLWLAGLLLVAGGQSLLPRWVWMAALVLIPLSAASAYGGLYLSAQTGARWPMLLALTVPPLLLGYVFSVSQAALRPLVGSPWWSGSIWGTILILSIVLWPSVMREKEQRTERLTVQMAEQDKVEAAMEANKKADNLEKVNGIRADQHLVDWYPLLDEKSGVRQEAIEKLKTIPRRQGDVEEGLRYGILAVMWLVPELDLSVTPAFCQSAQAFLEKTAQSLRLNPGNPSPYPSDLKAEQTYAGVRWIATHGCDCSAGIATIEKAVRAYQDSPSRRQTLKLLSEVGRP